MKKKAVFFSSGKGENFRKVYTPKIMERMKSLVDICEGYINRDNLEANSEILKNAEVAFSTWGMPSFTEEEIRQYMPNLKCVFYAAGSVQGFARPFLKNGITVVSAWAANAVPVAEYTVAQMLLAGKGFLQTCLKAKNNDNYSQAKYYVNKFPGNYGTKVGILGAGMIGSKVIELLKPYNFEIWVFDPFLPDDRAKALGVEKHSLEEIFEECQTISNHLANNAQTVGILNGNLFNRMKDNATFINTGRGAQVVEEDLIKALKEKPDRTAILDVTYPEPPHKDSEFYKLENVFLTPHIAGSMNAECERMASYMLDEFELYQKGEKLRYSVSLEMLERMA